MSDRKASDGVPPAAKGPRKRRPQGPGVRGGSAEARKVAAAVLEVMAGVRTPEDAAAALGVSPPRYYTLEGRALDGFVRALEPRPKGRSPTPEREAEHLKKEMIQMKKEVLRHQALARAAQRAVGLTAARGRPSQDAGSSRRRRRPTVRALKAAKRLQSAATPEGAEGAVAMGADVAPAAAST